MCNPPHLQVKVLRQMAQSLRMTLDRHCEAELVEGCSQALFCNPSPILFPVAHTGGGGERACEGSCCCCCSPGAGQALTGSGGRAGRTGLLGTELRAGRSTASGPDRLRSVCLSVPNGREALGLTGLRERPTQLWGCRDSTGFDDDDDEKGSQKIPAKPVMTASGLSSARVASSFFLLMGHLGFSKPDY